MQEKYFNLILEHYESVKARVDEDNIMFVALYGSQNYGLDTKNSDVDTKALVLPTLNELISYHRLSTTIQGDSLGGLCDLKHIQLMFNNFMKQNINFLEILWSDYIVLNNNYREEYNELIDNRELITGCNPTRMLHAARGMALQKIHAMEKPFESKLSILEKYGYDPKQLASLLRLKFFCREYLKEKDFASAIHPVKDDKKLILTVKEGEIKLDNARIMAKETMQDIDNSINKAESLFNDKHIVTKQEKEAQRFLDDLTEKLIKKQLTFEISKK